MSFGSCSLSTWRQRHGQGQRQPLGSKALIQKVLEPFTTSLCQYSAPTLPLTMHYRLRGSIGFLNAQKKSKSKRLFLTQGTPKYDKFALFVKIMTQILCQKSFTTFSENKYAQNHGQCSEKVEGSLSEGWILPWWKYWPSSEKSSK